VALETTTSITEEVAKIIIKVVFKIWIERNKALEQWTRKTLKTTIHSSFLYMIQARD
jgi:hypothetical protein